MSTSVISSGFYPYGDLSNSASYSVTAIAGDIIFITLAYRDTASALFSSPTWNGQTAEPCGVRTQHGGFFLHDFYIHVNSSATANISTSSDNYTYLNFGYAVLRSSLLAYPDTPLKSYQKSYYDSGTYTDPSLTNSLVAGDVVLATLATTGWEPDFDTPSTTYTVGGSAILIGGTTSTAHPSLKHLYLSGNTGVGSTVSSYVRSDSGTPMYQFSTAVFYEAAQQILSFNGGSAITAGQQGIVVTTSGFTSKPTSVTATYEAGTKSITATIGAGTASNFVIGIQDRVDGEDWPLSGAVVNFTFAYGSEIASISSTLNKKAGESDVTFVSPEIVNMRYLTAQLASDGFTVDGGELIYTPYDDLEIYTDGDNSVSSLGSFTSWFRPATGTGAGNVYAYTWIVSEVGITPYILTNKNHYIGFGLGIGF